MNIFGIFTRLNIGPRLLLGFGVLLGLTLVVGGASLYAGELRDQEEARVRDSAEEVIAAGEIGTHVSDALRFEQTFLARLNQEGYAAAYQNYVLPNQIAMQEARAAVDRFEASGRGYRRRG